MEHQPVSRWSRPVFSIGYLLVFASLIAQLLKATDTRTTGTLAAQIAGLACLAAAHWLFPDSALTQPRHRRWAYVLSGFSIAFGLIALFGFN